MALTYTQRDSLATNSVFLGRVRTAVRYHASYLLANAGATQQQKDWAAQMFWAAHRSAQASADLAPQLCNDPAIIGATNADASDVSDAAVQGAVDVICENYA